MKNKVTELSSKLVMSGVLTKVERMDKYLESFGIKVKGNGVREAVKGVFGVDLNHISEKNHGSKLASYTISIMESLRLSLHVDRNSTGLDAHIMAMNKNEVMDRFIEVHDSSLTGADNRLLINQIFGVNLDGISGLEHERISIFSKGQWILQGDSDLFMVSSSLDDVELYVASTNYYEEMTGSNHLPDSLKQKLISLGFTYKANLQYFVYRNSTNESVSDTLKVEVLGTVVGTIQSEYVN